mmetsp:Transcript_27469/g.50698  ORF Transcript_27469/g.50698 Transcript_27469/m.50698 type:complete len:321 (+) Transcript_27469:1016-1978(+)
MGAVSDKKHTAMHELVQFGAAEFIDAHPVEAEIHVPDDRLDPWDHLFLGGFCSWVRLWPQLQVDPVDVVGLFVQQGRLAGMEGGREPEPAFGIVRGKGGVGQFDVDDEKVFFEGLPVEGQIHTLACWGPRPLGCDVVFGLEVVGAIGGFDGQAHMVAVVGVIGDFVEEPQVDMVRKLLRPFDKVLFDVVLLQVDKGRVFVPVLGLQVKAVDLACAVKEPSDFPCHPFGQHPLAHAEAIEDFQRAFGPTDGAAAHRHDVVVVQDHGFDAVLRQIDGHGQTDGACAHDGHGVAGLWCGQAGWFGIGEGRVIIGHRDGPFGSA